MAHHKLRILITGSSGLLGSVISERFARQAEVIGLDLVAGKWTTKVGDITDSKLVASLTRSVDAIVHCAGLHAPHVGRKSDEEFLRINVEGTKILLDAALREGIKRFILTSTTSVYGCTSRPKDKAIWVTEELEPQPEDIYDFTKLEAERLCQEASKAGLKVAVLRTSRCFPEPDPLIIFYRLYRGVDRRDVAEGHWLATVAPLGAFEIVILSAEPVFKKEDVALLWKDPWPVIDKRAPGLCEVFLRMGWDRPPRIDRVYSIDKAKDVLRYRPRYGWRNAFDEISRKSSGKKARF